MTATETRHAGAFVVSEAPGMRSRDSITIQSGEGVILPGQILGKCRGVADTVVVSAPSIVGTGNGVLTKASPAYGAGVKGGVYKIVFVEPATDLGAFVVEDPDGVVVGHGNVGTAFTGVIKFTIADGSADYVAGDYITLTVTIYTDAKEYRSCDNTNTDGSEVAAAVAVYGCDATSAAQTIAAVTRDAEIDAALLVYDAALSTTALKTVARQQLAAAGIIAR